MPAITLLQPFNLDATKDYTFGNVTANVKTDNLMYANGTPYVLGGSVAGSNTQVQFNDANAFGSSANFTFDKSTNSLSVTNIIANGAGLTNIAGANVTGFVPNANVANTAFSVSGGNVSGQVANALVAGTVYTNAQPNITSVGTLTSLTVTGALASGDATVTGNLTVSGTTITANVSSIIVKDPIIEQGGEVSGALTTNDGKDRGQLLHYYSGGVIDAFMGWDNSNAEFAFGSNVSVSSEVVTFNTLGNLRAGVYFGNGSGLTSIAGANVTGFVPNANVANTAYSVSGANVSGDVSGANHANVADSANSVAGANVTGFVANANVANTAYSVSGANVSGDVAGANHANVADVANSVSGSNVTGQVGNALVAGTVYTNSQPNITSIGTLTSLDVSGNVSFTGANVSLGNVSNLKIAGGTANYVLKTDGAGNLSWTSITSGTGNANVSGSNTQIQYNDGTNLGASANLTFDVTTKTLTVDNLVANGVGLTFITGANVNGFVPNANVANTAYSVSGANVSGDVAGANHANVADVANTVAGANVTGTVANATYAVTSGTSYSVSGSNVSGAVAYATTANSVAGANVSGQVGNSLVAGTVYTNAQPNITSVGTLTSLDITGNVSAGNANLGNLVTANFFTGNGSLLTSITGANVTGTVANANYSVFAGTAYFVSGSNVSGEVAFAATSNSVAGANVSGQVGNALVAGTVYTNAQPNITSVGTLTSLSVTGNLVAGNIQSNATLTAVDAVISGNLTVSGTTTTVNSTTTQIVDPLFELGSGANGAVLTSNDGKDRGTLLHYYTGSTATDAFIGWDNSNAEFAFGSNVSVSNEVVTFNTLGNLRAGFFLGNGSQLTGLPAGYTNTDVANYLPNYTGNLSAGNANLGNLVTANFFSGSGNLLSNIQGYNVSGQVGNAAVASTVYTNAQPNITSVGTLTSLNVTGNITSGNANLGNAVAANFFVGDGSLLTGIANASSSGTANTVTNNAQPNITSVGTLTSLNVSGNVSFTGANVSLGSVSNLHITGGSSSQFLQTDGSGNLVWANPVASLDITQDSFTGNGVQTTFTLSVTPSDEKQITVNYNGATMLRSSYTLSGANLVFDSPPANNSLLEVTTINTSTELASAGRLRAMSFLLGF
jgi:hypothetical protein